MSFDDFKFEVTYGPGEFLEGDSHCVGTILLDSFKLFIRSSGGSDLTQSFIALDKVQKIQQKGSCLFVASRLSVSIQRTSMIKGSRTSINALVAELVRHLGMKKVAWRKIWVEED